MIKKLKFTVILLFVIAAFFSCSQEDLEITQTSNEQFQENLISEEQASQYALDFVNKINKETRSSDSPFRVESVKVIGEGKKDTRLGNTERHDSLFYIVDFADNKGFAIVSTAKDDTHVYGYVEEGNYDENDTINSGFRNFMSSIIEGRKNGVRKVSGNFVDNGSEAISSPVVGQLSVSDFMFPLLKTKWSVYTHNDLCPEFVSRYSGDIGHFNAGSAPIAVSQICTFLKSPEEVSYIDEKGNAVSCKIDWKKSDGVLDRSSDLFLQMCHLVRYWGYQFDVCYGSDIAFGDSYARKDVFSTLKRLGYRISMYDGIDDGFDRGEQVIEDLRTGNKIVLVQGNYFPDPYKPPYTWVIDGYVIGNEGKGDNSYFHCNWGDGISNGYFLLGYTVDSRNGYPEGGRKATRTTQYYNFKACSITRFDIPPSAPEVSGVPDELLFPNTDYLLNALNKVNEGVLEYEWSMKDWRTGDLDYKLENACFFENGDTGERIAERSNWCVKLRFIAPRSWFKSPVYKDMVYSACVRVRARNKYGWSDYTEVPIGIIIAEPKSKPIGR